MKRRIEALYALLHCGPETHMETARYAKRSVPFPAEFFTTNAGIPHQASIHCGHNPFLVAAFSTNLLLTWEKGGEPNLSWTTPERLICDPTRPYVFVDKVPGISRSARVSLPLVRGRVGQ